MREIFSVLSRRAAKNYVQENFSDEEGSRSSVTPIDRRRRNPIDDREKNSRIMFAEQRSTGHLLHRLSDVFSMPIVEFERRKKQPHTCDYAESTDVGRFLFLGFALGLNVNAIARHEMQRLFVLKASIASRDSYYSLACSSDLGLIDDEQQQLVIPTFYRLVDRQGTRVYASVDNMIVVCLQKML